MRRHGIAACSVRAFALLCLTASLGYGAAAAAKEKKNPKFQLQDDLFTNSQVFRIQIEIPEAAMRTLRDYNWRGWGGPQQERPSVKCTVREGTNLYKEVALHLKGAAGSFRSIDDEPSLTLNFAKHIKGQTFHGIQRFSLNNSVQDRSLLNEQISRELFAKCSVPVPRATHAAVQLNGRKLGVYVLVEAFNKQFLARHFKNPNGNLYDGGFVKDVTDDLEKSSGPNPEDRSDLQRLAAAARERDQAKRLEELSRLLNLDQFIRYLAVDVMTCNWDGYGMNRNNYRIYHDPDTDKIVFMPHGLDQMFGVMRVTAEMPILPQMQGLVARAVLQTHEGRERYRQTVSQLLTNLFRADVLTNRINELSARIRPALEEQSPGAARFQQQEAKAFSRRVVERIRSIQEQLVAPERSLQFDAKGEARFADWQSRADFGKPILDQVTEGGKKVLHVSAAQGSAVGVWSTKVWLEPGHYRLEGNVKSQGVVADAGDRKAGAGLRVSGRRFNQKLTGTADWTPMAFEFDVGDQPEQFGFMGPIQDAQPSTELLCELRAAKGEAWFDLNSLKLIRK